MKRYIPSMMTVLYVSSLLCVWPFWRHMDDLAHRGCVDMRAEQMVATHLVLLAMVGYFRPRHAWGILFGSALIQVLTVIMKPIIAPPALMVWIIATGFVPWVMARLFSKDS